LPRHVAAQLAALLILASGAWTDGGKPGDGAAEAPAFESTTLYVDAGRGDDDQSGDASPPLASLDKALERAHTLDGPVQVRVAAGTYREGGLRITRRSAPLLIEGSAPGDVVISGADVWSQWAERDGVLVAEWPHDWEAYRLNPGFPKRDHDAFRPAGQRSELVRVNGQRLTQVTDLAKLAPGTYRVDNEADTLSVVLPEGTDADRAVIEVGIRANLLTILQAKGITLRNLVFRDAVNHPTKAEGFGRYAVAIFGEHRAGMTNDEAGPERTFAEEITLDHVEVVGNNHGGLTIANTKHLTARHCRFDDNGVTGIGANRNRYLRFEDCSFNRNNWRLGKLGHVIGWGPAGTKMLFMSDLSFVRCTFNDNYATGLWLDTAVEHVHVEDCEMSGNWGTGFYFEHSQGPAVVKGSLITRNGFNDGSRNIRVSDGGVLFAESEDLTLVDNRIVDNINYQVAARPRDRAGKGYWSGREIDGACRRLTMRGNVVAGGSFDGPNAPDFYKTGVHRVATLVGRQVHGVEAYYIRDLLTTFKASGNRYHHADTDAVFSTGTNYGYDRVGLERWRTLTGQEADSVWGPIPPADDDAKKPRD